MFDKGQPGNKVQSSIIAKELPLLINDVPVTNNFMARLAPDKKKPGLFEKVLLITACVFSLDILLFIVLTFGKQLGYLSDRVIENAAGVFFIVVGFCFTAFVFVVAREAYHMISNKGEYQTLMVDAHRLKEEALFTEIMGSEISRDVLCEFADRIALSIKLLKERSGVIVIVSAVFVAFQALSDSTGFDLPKHFGILILLGAGVVALILMIDIDMQERLHHVLKRAVDKTPVAIAQFGISQRRRKALRG